MRRHKGIRWDYNGDGRFVSERIPGFWKRYWRRWNRRRLKKETREASDECDVGKARACAERLQEGAKSGKILQREDEDE